MGLFPFPTKIPFAHLWKMSRKNKMDDTLINCFSCMVWSILLALIYYTLETEVERKYSCHLRSCHTGMPSLQNQEEHTYFFAAHILPLPDFCFPFPDFPWKTNNLDQLFLPLFVKDINWYWFWQPGIPTFHLGWHQVGRGPHWGRLVPFLGMEFSSFMGEA